MLMIEHFYTTFYPPRQVWLSGLNLKKTEDWLAFFDGVAKTETELCVSCNMSNLLGCSFCLIFSSNIARFALAFQRLVKRP